MPGDSASPTPDTVDWTALQAAGSPIGSEQAVGPAFPTQFHDPLPPSTFQPAPPPAVRFAPLSSLPPGQRIPTRRATTPSATQQAVISGIEPRQLPGMPPVNPGKLAVPFKQIGFNCPSCLAILIIKQLETYDGQAAPCPSCGVVILPPRIAAPVSPFTLLSPAGAAPLSQIKPQALPAPAPASKGPTKPGLPGARKLAQAAMF